MWLLVSLRPLPPSPPSSSPLPPHACLLISLDACFRLELHSSYARPAPNPAPTNAGHARRLNKSTEKTTPKPRPREDLMMALERQKSHCLFGWSAAVYRSIAAERGWFRERAGRSGLGCKTDLLVEKRLANGPGDRARRGRRGRGLRRRVGHCEGVWCVCVCVYVSRVRGLRRKGNWS